MEPEHKVFVGGISWQLDDKDLAEVFEKYRPSGAQVMKVKSPVDKFSLSALYPNCSAQRADPTSRVCRTSSLTAAVALGLCGSQARRTKNQPSLKCISRW